MFRKKRDDDGDKDSIDEFREPVRRPRRPMDRDPFDDMFGDFGQIDRMMNEMMKGIFGNMKNVEPGKPYVYGFSMKTGPDGKPIVREFGNVKPKGEKIINDAREPMVDVVESPSEVIVIAELPGVEKSDINLEAVGDSLEIKVDAANKKYYKRIELPCEVWDGVDASYKNGVLEIKLKRRVCEKPKGKKIEIK